jgi:hypothetical protein
MRSAYLPSAWHPPVGLSARNRAFLARLDGSAAVSALAMSSQEALAKTTDFQQLAWLAKISTNSLANIERLHKAFFAFLRNFFSGVKAMRP